MSRLSPRPQPNDAPLRPLKNMSGRSSGFGFSCWPESRHRSTQQTKLRSKVRFWRCHAPLRFVVFVLLARPTPSEVVFARLRHASQKQYRTCWACLCRLQKHPRKNAGTGCLTLHLGSKNLACWFVCCTVRIPIGPGRSITS